MRNWRALLSVIGVVALSAAAGACGGDDSDSDAGASTSGSSAQVEPPSGLVKEGKLVQCADLSFPPMTFEDPKTKEPTGFDVDAARAVADLWSVDLEVQNMPFDGILPALASGRCDLAWTGIFVTPERLKTFSAIPYLETAEVILVPEGNPESISLPDDLSGKTAATQSGTEYVKSLREIEPRPNIQTYPKMTDAIQQLVVERADAVVTQDTEAAYRSTQQPGAFEVAYTYPDAVKFGVYFGKSNTEMKSALGDALRSLEEEGTLTEIAEQYQLPADNLLIR
jgi:polar amino acid transport system substrate-binding protein